MNTEKFDRPIDPQKWWLYHRIKFNKGLVIGGLVTFVLYTLFSGQIFSISNAEAVTMVMFYECIAYIIYMVLANLFYTVGCWPIYYLTLLTAILLETACLPGVTGLQLVYPLQSF